MNSGRSLLKNGQKYLANQDDLLQPINSSLTSGIFSRTTYSGKIYFVCICFVFKTILYLKNNRKQSQFRQHFRESSKFEK